MSSVIFCVWPATAFDAAVAAMLDDARGWRLAELRKRRGMTGPEGDEPPDLPA